MKSAEFYIKKLNMTPIPENGFISPIIHRSWFSLYVNYSWQNWAYYLLPEGFKCILHKFAKEESWIYCDGSPLDLYVVDKEGNHEYFTLGRDLNNDERFMHVVPSDCWQCAKSKNRDGFTLILHSVTPEFLPGDSTLGTKDILKKEIKDEQLIEEFCWENCT